MSLWNSYSDIKARGRRRFLLTRRNVEFEPGASPAEQVQCWFLSHHRRVLLHLAANHSHSLPVLNTVTLQFYLFNYARFYPVSVGDRCGVPGDHIVKCGLQLHRNPYSDSLGEHHHHNVSMHIHHFGPCSIHRSRTHLLDTRHDCARSFEYRFSYHQLDASDPGWNHNPFLHLDKRLGYPKLKHDSRRWYPNIYYDDICRE